MQLWNVRPWKRVKQYFMFLHNVLVGWKKKEKGSKGLIILPRTVSFGIIKKILRRLQPFLRLWPCSSSSGRVWTRRSCAHVELLLLIKLDGNCPHTTATSASSPTIVASSHTILHLQRSSIMKFLSEILPFHSLWPTLLRIRWQDTFSTLWVVVGCDKAKGQCECQIKLLINIDWMALLIRSRRFPFSAQKGGKMHFTRICHWMRRAKKEAKKDERNLCRVFMRLIYDVVWKGLADGGGDEDVMGGVGGIMPLMCLDRASSCLKISCLVFQPNE